MGVKALVFDIDGTILNSKTTMTWITYTALKECSQNGFLICIATARSGRIVFRKEDIQWEHGFLLERGILYNGGTIFDTPHHFYQHTAVPGQVVQQVVNKVIEYDDTLQIALQHDDQYHAFKIPMPDAQLKSWGFKQDELINFHTAKSKPATKIMVFAGTNFHGINLDLSSLYNVLAARFSDSTSVILADSRQTIYLVSKYANKGAAIKTLISFYDIKPEEVAVFGDDTPDLGMFGMFGYSIAMNNAQESLKQRATFITKSNDDEGVVFALKNYLNIL
jgi:Cof subfamily protein (haloacid dehalogenase superfamily)